MILGAGIILKKKDGTCLVVHPTNQTSKFFSFPKGGRDKEKDNFLSDTAIRELYEETNIQLPKTIFLDFVGTSQYKNQRKMIYFFKLEEEEHPKLFERYINNVEYKCNSMVKGENPFPEVDLFLWLTKDELEKVLHYSQKHLLKFL